MKSSQFDLYLLIFNISKLKNAGTLIRSAAAFNCKEVFLIDSKKKTSKAMVFFGSHGTEQTTNYRIFKSIQSVREYCTKQHIFICGVEIMPSSKPVQCHPFMGSTLIVMGNEGTGLNVNQKEICDQFIYIPQYSTKTACLNVAVAGSIIMEHFAEWAKYAEMVQVGEKFVTDASPKLGYIINEDKEEEVNVAKPLSLIDPQLDKLFGDL